MQNFSWGVNKLHYVKMVNKGAGNFRHLGSAILGWCTIHKLNSKSLLTSQTTQQ